MIKQNPYAGSVRIKPPGAALSLPVAALVVLGSVVLLASVLVVSAQPASAAETADWLPLKGTYNNAIGCTWEPNGCGLIAHTDGKKGIDFMVSAGTPIYAAGPGEVVLSHHGCTADPEDNCNGGAGNWVVIDHPDGSQSRYLHLERVVKDSGSVARGQLIGYSGNSGGSPVAHLHYEERINGTLVDPGAMKAVHGDSLKQYPNALGPNYDTWNSVPAHGNHTLRNDSFKAPSTRSAYATSDSTRNCSGAQEGQPPWIKFFYLPDAGGCIAEGAEGNSYGLLVNDLNKVVFHADTGKRLGVAKDLDLDLFRGANSVTHQEFCKALEAIPDQAMTPKSYLKQYANVKERLILDPNGDGIACTAKDRRAKIGRFYEGTSLKDKIEGTSGNDIIYGRGGNDTIYGRGGSDRLYGHAGKDHIFGQDGNDRLYGQGGRDTLTGGRGRDVLIGGPSRDILRGGPGRDTERQ